MIHTVFKSTSCFMRRDTIVSDIKKIERCLSLFLKKKLPKEISVIFVTSRYSKILNKKYRKKNKPANVLSFVYSKEDAEIFIVPSVVRNEAVRAGESFETRLAKMVIHGMIHCSGLDHERSKQDEKKFETLEKSIIRKL